MHEVKWGVIGCGDVTEVKSGPPLYKTPRSGLAAVMRRDLAKAQDYARRHNVPRAYGDADELIADPEVNAVYVATPPESHARWAIAALEAGKPVYVEKPMGLNAGECRAMIDAAKASGCSLSVAYYRRRLPRFEKMRALIADGAIGAPRCATVVQRTPRGTGSAQSWKLDPAIGGGGHFPDMQAHVLDWFSYAFGAPRNIESRVRRQSEDYKAEDFVSYIADFGGITVTAQCAYSVAERADEVCIFGDEGSVSMGFLQVTPVTLRRGSETETFDIPDPEHVQAPMIADVVAHLLGEGPNPCSGEEGMRATEFMDAVYAGYRRGE